MDIQALKLSFIEKIMQIQDKAVLQRLYKLLEKESEKQEKPWMKLAGSIDAEDAKRMMDAIEDGCEKIDVNEW